MTNSALPERTVMGSCEIRSVLGQGGGGISYLAYDRALEREVVIKEHFPMGLCRRREGRAEIEPQDDEIYTRSLSVFCREARILAGLNHPNVVKVHDIYEASGTAYIVMEYVEGSTLREWMQKKASDVAAVSACLAQLLRTLHYLHGNSVLHRDIKPSNIIIREDEQPILIDFGSAHLGTANHTLTPVGSPGYAAPEQFSPGGRVGAWSDLYALAQCILHNIPQVHKKLYPQSFLKALQKAAAAEIGQRFTTAEQWLACLTPPQRKRMGVPGIVGIVLASAFLGGLMLHTMHQLREEPAPISTPHPEALPNATVQQPAETISHTPETPGLPGTQATEAEAQLRPEALPDATYYEPLEAMFDTPETPTAPGTQASEAEAQLRPGQWRGYITHPRQQKDPLVLSDGTVVYDPSGKHGPNDAYLLDYIEYVMSTFESSYRVYLRTIKYENLSDKEKEEMMRELKESYERQLRYPPPPHWAPIYQQEAQRRKVRQQN
ncbi:MAG: protein kinase [Akkermansia sp.]|nr:protein kinase [Akkermansia sp.]